MARKPVAARITDVQQGIVTQNEFAKLLMLTSDGQVEVNPPKTDDERRDFELHRKGRFGRTLSLQAKSALQLIQRTKGRPRLGIYIGEMRGRPRASRSFYYLLGWFDPVIMRFRDPVFLVPSLVLYRKAMLRKTGRYWHLNFNASVDPGSRDKWAPYQVSQKELGRRLIRLMDALAGASRKR
ncbi:MAG TPA: hypothetical protein VET65_08810 [Candidatus Limnocylindrales bacterium]|nr:hypothetical protein [Candidatus Limnocylindrales bacterium]